MLAGNMSWPEIRWLGRDGGLSYRYDGTSRNWNPMSVFIDHSDFLGEAGRDYNISMGR